MKITMAKRDDILKRREAWENLRNKSNEEHDQYENARYSVFEALQAIVKDKIGSTSLSLNIRASENRRGTSVYVDNGDNPHDEQALNWKWNVTLSDKGEIEKDSGSWSNLSATTPEQIANLKESVRIIEILNNLDWNELLTVELPNFDDYLKTEVPKRENFEEQLLEADVEDAAEQGLLIKGHGYKWYAPRASVFYKILNMTDKSFKVQEIYEDYLGDESRWRDPYTIRKDNFFKVIDKPIKTAEV